MLDHFANAALASGRMRWIGPCRIPGRLIDCGAYPALVDGPGEVVADLFEIADDALLAALDAYEEYDPADPDGSEYRRVKRALLARDGEAWTYVWNRAPGDLPVIESGDWLAYLGQAPRDPPRNRPGGDL